MRVLVVTTWWPTSASPGTGVFVARDVAAIAGRHQVVVLHLVAPRLADRAGSRGPTTVELPVDVATGDPVPSVPVEQLVMDPRRPDHVARAARRVAQLQGRADLVHTMAVSALLPFAGRRPPQPWVHTEHWSGLAAPGTLSRTLRAARQVVRPLLARPDVVAVVGQGLAREVRRLRRGPVRVVPNIVPAPTEPAPRRDPDLPLSGRGALELVAVGGLIPRKDPVRAVLAAAELRRRGVEARLTWVGEGVLRDEVEREARAHAVPLRLTGSLPPGEVQAALEGADLLLLPTRAETFCLAAAEALASGRPVVVGDVEGPRDFVAPPTGALVPPGAPAGDWADAVERVWAAAAALAADDVARPLRERFGAEAYADRVDEVYALATTRAARTDRASRTDRAARTDRGGKVLPRRHGATAVAVGEKGGADPEVDVVIAVHSTERDVGRAVRSVLDGSPDLAVRVSVVAHNLPAGTVREQLGDQADDPRVRVLEVRDGIPSPSGPFNAGIDAATAPWVAIMGSDDALAPGALAGWLDAADGAAPDEPVVVLPRLELSGRRVPTPPSRVGPSARRGASRAQDLVRDRLSYRSAPLGLISRGALSLPGTRLHPGARVGEDLPMMTALYAQARVILATGAPAYLIHEDAPDRITGRPRPISEQLETADVLWDLPWMSRLTEQERRAVGTKVLRIQVFGAILGRPDPWWWTAQERAEMARVTRRVLVAAPGCAAPLSLADRDLLAAALDPGVPAPRLVELARARRRHGTPRTLLPSSWRHALDPEAPLRFMPASLRASRRPRP
ncbi:glycosyl transferase, group 1 [Serinicoccus hydrothermalis]|uniref:Glycosyl transferase, group 1 n=1 Tax=Serinicoccus hydrothermalis TaxID=1758689 RepID=A0A1B1N944_9MICO|nr:glycosyltransferase [Serinicoccus hydrothermalis]ANS77936.1 glycosyl transferase, group 1 [Serinicoccus hydrothermalis]